MGQPEFDEKRAEDLFASIMSNVGNTPDLEDEAEDDRPSDPSALDFDFDFSEYEKKANHNMQKNLWTRRLLVILILIIVIIPFLFLQSTFTVDEISSEDYCTATIQVTVNSWRPLYRFEASTDQAEPKIKKLDSNTYAITVEQNCTVTLQTRSLLGKAVTETREITCIDEEEPSLVSYKQTEEGLTVELSDGASGIDEDAVYCTDEEGNRIDPSEVNGSDFLFPYGDGALTLHAADRKGNVLTANFNVVYE